MTGPSLSETTHSYFPPDILLLYGFPDLPRASALLVTTDCIVSMSSCEEEQQQQLHHIRRCTPHPRRAVFQARLLDNSTRCQHRRIRFRKALGEMFPTPSFLAPALFRLWRYRAWTIGPGGCDIHIHTVVYETDRDVVPIREDLD